jgi:hypothetical protein
MANDAMLNARPDADWMNVLLRARQIRTDTLVALAETWAERPDLVIAHLDALAATVERRGAAWDSAVDDAEGDLQMDEADMSLDETRALQLADELRAAASQTLAARLRASAARPIPFPHQQDRSAA